MVVNPSRQGSLARPFTRGSAGRASATRTARPRDRSHRDIRDKIASREYPPADKLPSLREMTALRVFAEPVRSALLILRAEGLIEGHQGKGPTSATRSRSTRLH
ncbi:GntR family transcriptional regulator [Micromonospora sp. NPDC049645]|uniref:GntR family transcriptional regulator n=1 Tax=Micromonospora sp. NPDC049645 TaxID=3155508 RepID=UPI00342BE541